MPSSGSVSQKSSSCGRYIKYTV